MLTSLLDGKETSSCIVIEDSVEQKGRGVLKAFVCALLNRVDVVHVVLYDLHPRTFVKGLPANAISSIRIHDGAQDPLGWDPQDTGTGSHITMDTDLWLHLLAAPHAQKQKVAIVIDSLSKLVLHHKGAHTCQVLNKLVNRSGPGSCEVVQVVALLHRDLHDDTTLGLLRYTATSLLQVEPPKQPDFHAIIKSIHKRVSGKVIRSCEHFSLKSDWTLESVEEVFNLDHRIATNQDTTDPAADLTFNLSLTDSEREARSQLVLPYVHNHKKTKEVGVSANSAKIFYQPDDADDFDEEDPDDDLDV